VNSRTSSESPERDPDHSDGNLTVIVATSLEDLHQYAAEWDELAFVAPQQEPMLSHAWMSAYFEHCLLPHERWHCLLALQGKRLVGVLPLLETSCYPIGLRRPLLRTPSDLQTVSVDVLAAEGLESAIADLFCAALDDLFPRWQTATFTRLPASSPLLKLPETSSRRLTVLKRFDSAGAYLPTVGSFDEYRAGLSKNFRRNLKKLNNKTAQLADVNTEFLSCGEASEKQLNRFMEVETASWKGREKTAILMSPPTVAFYRALCRNLATRGWLEWHFLSTQGKTIAGNLAIRCGRSVVIWKIGYDEAFARCGPGTILFERLAQRAFEADDIDQIDLMTDMPWHDNWRIHKREYHDLYVFPKRLIPTLIGVLPKRLSLRLRKVSIIRGAVQRLRSISKRRRG
jgi:CelD/BcsL family acetyltransferase involved in cellulose biosynthesis